MLAAPEHVGDAPNALFQRQETLVDARTFDSALAVVVACVCSPLRARQVDEGHLTKHAPAAVLHQDLAHRVRATAGVIHVRLLGGAAGVAFLDDGQQLLLRGAGHVAQTHCLHVAPPVLPNDNLGPAVQHIEAPAAVDLEEGGVDAEVLVSMLGRAHEAEDVSRSVQLHARHSVGLATACLPVREASGPSPRRENVRHEWQH